MKRVIVAALAGAVCGAGLWAFLLRDRNAAEEIRRTQNLQQIRMRGDVHDTYRDR